MMLFKSLALAASASAYLVLPPVPGVEEAFRALPIDGIHSLELPAHALEQSITVPCLKCKGGDQLKLDFSIARSSRLLLNGFKLYPDVDLWSGDLVASLVSQDGHEEKSRLGYSLDIQEGLRDAEQDLQLVDVELRVIEVGHQYVDDLPTVHVQLIKGLGTPLSLGKVSLKQVSEPACTSVMCRAKASLGKVMESIKKMKLATCGSKWATGTTDEAMQDQDSSKSPASSDASYELDEESFRNTDWQQFVTNMAWHIFLPILLGIVAGMVLAVVAMSIYAIALSVTRAVKSKRCRGGRCNRKKQGPRGPEADVEKTHLMSDDVDEQLPLYRDEVDKN